MSLKQYNKVIVGTRTIIDLTSDTVTSESLLLGRIAHSSDGSVITGSYLTDYFNLLLDNNSDVLTDSSGNQYTGDIGYISAGEHSAEVHTLNETILNNNATIDILTRKVNELQAIVDDYDSIVEGFILDSEFKRIKADPAEVEEESET